MYFLFTFAANATNKPLGLNDVDAGRDEKRLDAHIDETRDGRGSVVRVQCRQHEVAGERRLDGDLCRFEITDLADEDDVGILTQEGAKRGGKIEPDLLFHLDLIDALQVKFDRILGRHDICFRGVQRLQGRIKRIRLTRTRRSRDQNHPIRVGDRTLEFLKALRLEPELCHVEHQLVFIKQTKHDLFAKERGECRYTKIELARTVVDLDLDLDASVLRQAFLGNVELRHDLET